MAARDRDRRLIDKAVRQLRNSCADRLLTVALCGEAAGCAYRPGKSRLEFTAVVDRVDAAVLKSIAASGMGRWNRRIPAPLVLDEAYVSSALDVFPLEFLDLHDRHEILFGSAAPLSQLHFEREHLRLQIEQQLRGKLLHLWESYLGAATSRVKLRRLLLDTPAAFDTIGRGVLHICNVERPADPIALLASLERTLDLKLPTLLHLQRVRAGRDRLDRARLQTVFDSYLTEVRLLVKGVDAL